MRKATPKKSARKATKAGRKGASRKANDPPVSGRTSAARKVSGRKVTGRKLSGRRSGKPLLLSQVTLSRFKAAFKVGPVALHPFTVLIGRNGSGKSTLLEALQWIETTMREDARRACERYYGIGDLINLRNRPKKPYFKLALRWDERTTAKQAQSFSYSVTVEQTTGQAPKVVAEELDRTTTGGASHNLITTEGGVRFATPFTGGHRVGIVDPERLALDRSLLLGEPGHDAESSDLERLRDFWRRAVFVRLSPNRLAQTSPPRRPNVDEPILDEEGQNLPALLGELGADQRARLVEMLQIVLPDVRDIEVVKMGGSYGEQVFYVLKEGVLGRAKVKEHLVSIPAWMLSEGTRRITALFALLLRDPPPSLVCIEEIENGLDPWTLVTVLRYLQSAVARGVQVLVTTHSPWLLDHVELGAILHVHRSKGETVIEPFADAAAVRAYQGRVPPGAMYVSMDPNEQGQP